MLNFYVRQGRIVVELHNITSLKQNKGLGRIISFNKQTRNGAKTFSGMDFYRFLNNPFNVKTMENVRNRIYFIPMKKDEDNKMLK